MELGEEGTIYQAWSVDIYDEVGHFLCNPRECRDETGRKRGQLAIVPKASIHGIQSFVSVRRAADSATVRGSPALLYRLFSQEANPMYSARNTQTPWGCGRGYSTSVLADGFWKSEDLAL